MTTNSIPYYAGGSLLVARGDIVAADNGYVIPKRLTLAHHLASAGQDIVVISHNNVRFMGK